MSHPNYRIIFNDSETAIAECILIEIPKIKQLIDNIKNDPKVKDKYVIGMKTINSVIFSHIIHLVKKKIDERNNLEEFQEKYIYSLHPSLLIEFIHTTNIFELYDLQRIASTRFRKLINENSVDHIRDIFKIKNDFTPDEENNIKKDNDWQEII